MGTPTAQNPSVAVKNRRFLSIFTRPRSHFDLHRHFHAFPQRVTAGPCMAWCRYCGSHARRGCNEARRRLIRRGPMPTLGSASDVAPRPQYFFPSKLRNWRNDISVQCGSSCRAVAEDERRTAKGQIIARRKQDRQVRRRGPVGTATLR